MGVEQGKQKLHTRKFDAEGITVIPFGDNHVGAKEFDRDLFKRDLEEVLETDNAYALFMGDNIEAATRDSVGAGVYEQTEIIDKQMYDWLDMVRPLADAGKIIGMHTGNHEERIYKSCGLDISKMMARDLKVPYFGWTVHHLWKVGGQNYTLYSTHGSGGSRLPHTKIKAVIDRQNMSDVEVYMMGHLHQLSHHVRQFYSVDKRARQVVESEKHFVLCGSYLGHWGGYGEQAGYEMMRRGSPRVHLNGLEHKVSVEI